MVGFGRFKVFQIKLVNIFNAVEGDDKQKPPMIFRQSSYPDGTYFAQALYRSIIDCTSELPF